MKLLYGSQNFGYNLPDSDKDWLEFIYPTWGQIIKGEMISKERHNEDGSVTKVKDIRLIPKMIKKANFNDLQILFSQETEGCDDLKWFFENRQQLIRLNMWQLYCSNKGYINSQLKENTVKSIVRAYAFTFYLVGVLGDKEFDLHSKYFRELRNELNDKNKYQLVEVIINKVNSLRREYESYKDTINEELEKRMYTEIEFLLRRKL